jgi:hypothetical protein
MTVERHLRRRWTALIVAAALAIVVAGCETEDTIQVENTTSTQLRVMLKVPGGGVSTVAPTPGNSSSIVVSEAGTFYALAVVDAEWLETIRTRRDFLQSRLADPDRRRNLSADDLSDILFQINSLTAEIRRATERPLDNVGACSGPVKLSDSGGVAGKVTITDNPAGGFPAYILLCG